MVGHLATPETESACGCQYCGSDMESLATGFDHEGQFAVVPLEMCPACHKLMCPACDRFCCDECGMVLCADHLVSVWIEEMEIFAHVCNSCEDRARQREFGFVVKAAGRELRPSVAQKVA